MIPFAFSADRDDSETIPCPYCGKPIYEQSEICGRCGRYISQEDSRSRRPIWVIIVAVILMLIIIDRWPRFW